MYGTDGQGDGRTDGRTKRGGGGTDGWMGGRDAWDTGMNVIYFRLLKRDYKQMDGKDS